MASRTRSKKAIWLIGSPNPTLPGQKLPSKAEVLRFLMFLHVEMNETLTASVNQTSLELMNIWSTEGIPTKHLPDVVVHVRKLHTTWQGLKKSINRKTATNIEKQDNFKADLDELFDIAHADAMNLIKIDEDKEFLASQREKGRPGKIGSLDYKTARTSEKIMKRKDEEKKRKQKALLEMAATSETANLQSSSSSSSTESSPSQQPSSSIHPTTCDSQPPKRKRGTTGLTSEVTEALDRTLLSDRSASRVLIPFAKQLGQDINKLSLSPSAIRAARVKYRKQRAEEIKQSFKVDTPLVVHWDSKLMPDLTGRDKVDRLPILVTGNGVSKILAIPMLKDSKAEETAAVIFSTVKEWNLIGRVKGMCFDTTAVNTGIRGGVCVRIENILDHQLLYFACRHHVLELVLEAVYSSSVDEASRGPDITLFQTFRDCWPHFNFTQYLTAADDASTATDIHPWANSVIQHAQELLKQKHPRDDYKELLQLTIIFLGGVPSGHQVPTFRAPGAVHRARWMARAIYCFKIWMFQGQFSDFLTKRASSSRSTCRTERLFSAIKQVCLFVAKHYIRAWFDARNAASAPKNDLQLLQALHSLNHAAYKTMSRHLWYLSEVNVGLALFDDNLDSSEKIAMVINMKDVEGSEDPSRRVWLPNPEGKKLSDLCSSQTKNLFTLLELPEDFLEEKDPSNWKSFESYVKAKQRVDSLNVVNDAAERGVALIQDFTKAGRTRDEAQVQYLVQVMEDDRRKYPKASKETLIL